MSSCRFGCMLKAKNSEQDSELRIRRSTNSGIVSYGELPIPVCDFSIALSKLGMSWAHLTLQLPIVWTASNSKFALVDAGTKLEREWKVTTSGFVATFAAFISRATSSGQIACM